MEKKATKHTPHNKAVL